MFVATQSRTSWSLYALVLGSLLHLSSPPSAADDFYWINPIGGDVADPENWNPEAVPGDGDVAIFDLGTPGYYAFGDFDHDLPEIQVNNDTLLYLPAVERLSIGHAPGSVGTASLSFLDLEINLDSIPASPDGGLWVGEHGNGTLDMSGSGDVYVVGQIVVADDENAVGSIIMDGTWLGEPGFGTGGQHLLSTTIARQGTGTLSATNHSVVSLTGTFVVGQDAGSHGTVTVDDSQLSTPGFGSTSLTSTTIGAAGSGSLVATNESEVGLAGAFVVGRDAGSQGGVTLDDSALGGPQVTSTTIGAAGTGSLTAVNGSRLVDLRGTFIVGQDAGSQGVVTVDDSEFYSPGLNSATIGAAGMGSLSVANGSDVELGGTLVVGQVVGSQGAITFDDSYLNGQRLRTTTIGAAGTGSLSATNGSWLELEGAFVVGQEVGSQGMVTVGASNLFGSFLSSTTIGAAGIGSLSAIDGSELEFGDSLVVGQEVGSQGSVTVNDSVIRGGFNFTTIGSAGTGSVTATNGSRVYLGNEFIVGQDAGSQGTVTFNNSYVYGAYQSSTIGAAGSGSLSITNGSEVELSGHLIIGQQKGSQGIVTIDNSFLDAYETHVGGTRSGEGGSGTLSFTAGAVADVGYMQVWPTGSVEIDSSTVEAYLVVNNGVVHVNGILDGPVYNEMGGVLSGTGTISNSVHLNAGSQIIPGNSPGNLTLGYTYWSGDATFRFMINGAEGDAGSDPGWNGMSTLGFLSLEGSPTDPMRVSLMSLLPDNEAGDVFDFNPEKSYLWTFASATQGIYGFSPDSFIVDSTDFSNPIGSGYFEVRQIGNSLAVAFVPEPSALMLTVIGAAALLAWTRRKR